MKKLQSTIINANLSKLVNEKTGEFIDMTKIIYTVSRENTDSFVGPAMLECYRVGNYIEKIKPYVMKPVELELDEKPLKNGVKYVISKINNTVL